MAYFGSFDRGNPASSNYYKDPLAETYARTNAMKQNYFRGLQDRAQSVKALESAAMTSPEYQLQKYIWQSNEEMMPMQQPAYQPMQPWQIYAGQMQQPQAYSQGGTGAGQGVLSGAMPMQTQQTSAPVPLDTSEQGSAVFTQPYQQPSYTKFTTPSILSGGLW